MAKEYTFLDPSIASTNECGICHHVPSDSQKAQCCGATYCMACARQATTTACPNCSAPSPILMQDEARPTKISKPNIKCSHCRWSGELGDYETHRSLQHPNVPGGATPDFPVSRSPEADAHTQEREYDLQTTGRAAEEDEQDDFDGSERHLLIELQELVQEKGTATDHDESSDYNSSFTPFTASLATKKKKW